jgi:hypothetical protein
MSKKKKVLYMIIGLFGIIQFIRPAKNTGEVYTNNDISHSVDVPANVKNILERSCNDCHTNNTHYPWYTNIQPVGWWLNHHVEEGVRELNFSEFNTYKIRRKLHKLEEIAEQVKEGEMPLGTYTWIHGEAKLTATEQQILIDWALNSKALLDTVKIAAEQRK